ncbi:putative nuclease HARBI1 [Rhinatrema bivittatum]|uniref:putative nuclease HARBI1 n=1 Tax=Rhinatrema bivittatum TaxID=194408 RepID=UPI001125D656|nr:putative nuclease HARBI1 [Rhinatrema bivittatum]
MCINQVLGALLRRTRQYISFPQNRRQQEQMMQDIYQVACLPSVLGMIDCPHIPIRTPAGDEAIYHNRKCFHSLNIQVVCDAKGLILDVVPKFPGSTHNAYIIFQSGIHDHVLQGHNMGDWLLGDRGYLLKAWLMIPVATPQSAVEVQYNSTQWLTRSVIKRTFGLLKTYSPVWIDLGDVSSTTPPKVYHIFLACCMVHNLAKTRHMPLPESQPEKSDEEEEEEEKQELRQDELLIIHRHSQRRAIEERNTLIQRYFC